MEELHQNNTESASITQFLESIRSRASTLSVVLNSPEVEMWLSGTDYTNYLEILHDYFRTASINYADYSYKSVMSDSFDLVVDGITVVFNRYPVS